MGDEHSSISHRGCHGVGTQHRLNASMLWVLWWPTKITVRGKGVGCLCKSNILFLRVQKYWYPKAFRHIGPQTRL